MLRLHASNTGGTGSIPGQGAMIPHATWCSILTKKQLFRHFHSKIKLQEQLHLLLFLIYFPSPLTQIRPSNPPLNTHTLMHVRARTHTHTHTLSSVYFLTPSALYFSSIYLFTGFEQDPANSWGLPHPGTKPEPSHRAQGGKGEPDVMATGLQNK